MERSSNIDNDLINGFKKKYNDFRTKIHFPNECNGLEEVIINNEDVMNIQNYFIKPPRPRPAKMPNPVILKEVGKEAGNSEEVKEVVNEIITDIEMGEMNNKV